MPSLVFTCRFGCFGIRGETREWVLLLLMADSLQCDWLGRWVKTWHKMKKNGFVLGLPYSNMGVLTNNRYIWVMGLELFAYNSLLLVFTQWFVSCVCFCKLANKNPFSRKACHGLFVWRRAGPPIFFCNWIIISKFSCPFSYPLCYLRNFDKLPLNYAWFFCQVVVVWCYMDAL